LQRKQRLEQEALPLFAAEIAEGQPPADAVMADRAKRWDLRTSEDRARRAKGWRDARRKLATYPDVIRSALRSYWYRCSWPGDPSYLASMMHMYDTGRLDLTVPPWRPSE
jgi:hypothetical protein